MTTLCPICKNVLAADQSSCPACGYRMQGSTQKFTPIKLTDQDQVSKPENHSYDLRVVRGPQTGVDIDLRDGLLSIGRDPKCDIFLNDMTVSREHAEIEVGPDGCILRDHNSFNGVWVNDRMVKMCSLRPGDLIQIGAFCLVYRERP